MLIKISSYLWRLIKDILLLLCILLITFCLGYMVGEQDTTMMYERYLQQQYEEPKAYEGDAYGTYQRRGEMQTRIYYHLQTVQEYSQTNRPL